MQGRQVLQTPLKDPSAFQNDLSIEELHSHDLEAQKASSDDWVYLGGRGALKEHLHTLYILYDGKENAENNNSRGARTIPGKEKVRETRRESLTQRSALHGICAGF